MVAASALGKERLLDREYVRLIVLDPTPQHELGFLRNVLRSHPGLADVLDVGSDEFRPHEKGDAHVARSWIDGENADRLGERRHGPCSQSCRGRSSLHTSKRSPRTFRAIPADTCGADRR